MLQWEPKDPEPFAVNAALEQVEWDTHHREMTAWREQQRKPRLFLTGKQLLKVFVVALGLAALPWIVVYAVAAWFHL